MKVRRCVFIPIHLDEYSVEHADGWHGAFIEKWFSSHPPQIPIRGDGDEEFVLHTLDFECRVGFEGFPHGGLGVVAGGPGAMLLN
jgi:hypothetical protein